MHIESCLGVCLSENLNGHLSHSVVALRSRPAGSWGQSHSTGTLCFRTLCPDSALPGRAAGACRGRGEGGPVSYSGTPHFSTSVLWRALRLVPVVPGPLSGHLFRRGPPEQTAPAGLRGVSSALRESEPSGCTHRLIPDDCHSHQIQDEFSALGERQSATDPWVVT